MLAVLPLLPLPALRCRLLASRQLLHLLAQLFGLAPQHLLLPALLVSLLLLPLLLGQFLLAARQFLQLGQRFFDLLLALIGRSGIAARFELVLLAIQLQIKEPFQIAPRTSGASASAAECHLNVAE